MWARNKPLAGPRFVRRIALRRGRTQVAAPRAMRLDDALARGSVAGYPCGSYGVWVQGCAAGGLERRMDLAMQRDHREPDPHTHFVSFLYFLTACASLTHAVACVLYGDRSLSLYALPL